jgi:hypothetical protein
MMGVPKGECEPKVNKEDEKRAQKESNLRHRNGDIPEKLLEGID